MYRSDIDIRGNGRCRLHLTSVTASRGDLDLLRQREGQREYNVPPCESVAEGENEPQLRLSPRGNGSRPVHPSLNNHDASMMDDGSQVVAVHWWSGVLRIGGVDQNIAPNAKQLLSGHDTQTQSISRGEAVT